MSWRETLQPVLDWIGSHSIRLSRQKLKQPSPLSNASLQFLEGGQVTHTIPLDHLGRLPAKVNLEAKPYRLEVRDAEGEIIFTQDTIEVA